MTIEPKQKTELIHEFATHQGDTGSAEVQVAIISERIKGLTEHFKQHKKDHAGRRGLLMLVGKRVRLLRYLKHKNRKSFEELVKKLGIRAS